eukprot:jgi/Hompol1/2304/HPOL_000591-RA
MAKKQISDIKFDKQSASRKSQELLNEAETYKQTVTTMRATHDQSISELKMTIKDMSSKLKQAESEIEASKKEIESLKAKSENTNTQPLPARSSISREASLIEKMSEIEHALGQAYAQNEEYKRINDDLQTQIQTLREELDQKALTETYEGSHWPIQGETLASIIEKDQESRKNEETTPIRSTSDSSQQSKSNSLGPPKLLDKDLIATPERGLSAAELPRLNSSGEITALQNQVTELTKQVKLRDEALQFAKSMVEQLEIKLASSERSINSLEHELDQVITARDRLKKHLTHIKSQSADKNENDLIDNDGNISSNDDGRNNNITKGSALSLFSDEDDSADSELQANLDRCKLELEALRAQMRTQEANYQLTIVNLKEKIEAFEML